MKFAFLTRHQPTAEQHQLASEHGVELVPVGDADAFTVGVGFFDGHDDGPFDGVVVVHPSAALRLCSTFLIGVFENANRAAEGEKPSFQAVALHIYDLRD